MGRRKAAPEAIIAEIEIEGHDGTVEIKREQVKPHCLR